MNVAPETERECSHPTGFDFAALYANMDVKQLQFSAQIHTGWYNEFRAQLAEIRYSMPEKCFYQAYSHSGLEQILFDHRDAGAHRGYPGLRPSDKYIPTEQRKHYRHSLNYPCNCDWVENGIRSSDPYN